MRRVLNHCKECGIQSIKLDATPAGKPLYTSLGFKTEITIERWSAQDPAVLANKSVDLDVKNTRHSIDTFDREAFGACRRDLLDSLFKNRCCEPVLALDPSHALTGYGFARRGADAFYLGPIAASSESVAIGVLDGLIARLPSASIYVDYVRQADGTSAALTSRGFKLQRTLSRMSCGKASSAGISRLIFASAGPEFG